MVSGKIGVYYGRITNNSFTGTVGVYQSHAYHVAGDSGGPAVVKNPGVDYPSAGNGFQTAGTWAGITKAVIASWPAFSYTSSANILADLRARDEASGSDGTVFGAGFQVTSTPCRPTPRENPRSASLPAEGLGWSCRELNPGPPPPHQGFSVCSSLCLYLDLPVSRTSRDDDPSRCEMSRAIPRPNRTVEPSS